MMNPSTVLFQYGVAGVSLLALGYFALRQYNDNQRLQREFREAIEAKDAIIAQLQDARRQDAKEMSDNATMPLKNISRVLDLVYDKLRISKGN